MGTQNWNGGNRLVISQGQPVQALNSIVNPINVAFLYNSTQAAQEVPIDFVGANQYFEQVAVPQTTANAGSAALFTFSGPYSGGSASLTATLDPRAGSGAQVEAWLGGQAMPINTQGLNNQPLPSDGDNHVFNKYARYYFVPNAQRYLLTIQSGIQAFYFAVFNPSGQVAIHVLNAPDPNYAPIVKQFPGDAYAKLNTTVVVHQESSVAIPLFGSNQQWVLMNADSTNDSMSASVTLTPLG